MERQTHRVVMNGVLVETSDFVVFLHLFTFVRSTLLQSIQQLSLDAPQSYGNEVKISNFV